LIKRQEEEERHTVIQIYSETGRQTHKHIQRDIKRKTYTKTDGQVKWVYILLGLFRSFDKDVSQTKRHTHI
jgi:hypothetical protein